MGIKEISEIEDRLREIFNCKVDYITYVNKKIEIKFSSSVDDETIYHKVMSLKKRKHNKKEYCQYQPIMGEEWKEIEEYPGIKVSNLGRIIKNDKLVKLNEDKNGYQKISVKNLKGITKSIGVHRLVAIAFIENPDNKREVDHINTIRNDNRAVNLRWATPIENILGNEITLKRLQEKGKDNIIRMIRNALKNE